MHIEDAIEDFRQLLFCSGKLLKDYENYWEFWVVANKVMDELNDQFKILEEAKKKCFDDPSEIKEHSFDEIKEIYYGNV
jgi:hypothetical protein